MSQKEKFSERWNEFTALINGGIKGLINENGSFTAAEADAVVAKAIRRWFDETLPQGLWLKRLKQQDEEAGEACERILKNMKLDNVELVTANSSVPYVTITAVCGIGAWLIARSLSIQTNADGVSEVGLAWWQAVGIFALASASVGYVSQNIWYAKNRAKMIARRDELVGRLERYRLEILKQCEDADGK